MLYGQLVFGPPGSGKTTYCNGVAEFFRTKNRNAVLVNLDPANEQLPYTPNIDILQLVSLDAVMANEQLGPNGGFVFCFDFLEQNLDWLDEQLGKYSDAYFLFDCPGQFELYTVHGGFKKVVDHLTKRCNLSLCAVNLIDSICCYQPHNFLSALLVSLTSMLQLELPHVNVLSKIDLLDRYGPLDFDIDFYTEVQDLSYLLERINQSTLNRFSKLNDAIAEVVEDFGLVSFHTLDISSETSVSTLVKVIDKANGFALRGVADDAEGPGIWGITAKIIYDEYDKAVG